MTIRTTSVASLGVGTMVPRKHSKVEIQYIGNITHYGYFAKLDSGATAFLGRLEVEHDGSAAQNEIRIEFYEDDGGIF
jgi:hypothetical protein